MNSTSTIRVFGVFASVAVLASLGCASTSSVPATAPESPAPTTAAATPQVTTPKAPPRVTIQSDTDAAALAPVYFDTDAFVLRADARTALKAGARAIQQHPEWGELTIQGHCDERGSEEYNLALGERRATVVKQFLVDLGVPASRLETVTFGESRPALRGHEEAAWRMNRRSELVGAALQSASR